MILVSKKQVCTNCICEVAEETVDDQARPRSGPTGRTCAVRHGSDEKFLTVFGCNDDTPAGVLTEGSGPDMRSADHRRVGGSPVPLSHPTEDHPVGDGKATICPG